MAVSEVVIVGLDGAATRYRDVVGFPGYLTGDDGSVWSCLDWHGGIGEEWRRLRPRPLRRGHLRVALRRGGRTFDCYVHALVLTAFRGPRPVGTECCHFPDRNPANNRLDNLRWATSKDNREDQRKHGTLLWGEKNPGARLTDDDVLTIRRLHAAGGRTDEIADRFGVDRKTVWRIVNFQSRRETRERSPENHE